MPVPREPVGPTVPGVVWTARPGNGPVMTARTTAEPTVTADARDEDNDDD